jgi:hypothetical protein
MFSELSDIWDHDQRCLFEKQQIHTRRLFCHCSSYRAEYECASTLDNILGIKTVGLFRVSGDNEAVDLLQKEFDNGDIPVISGAEFEHLATNVLKSYLR